MINKHSITTAIKTFKAEPEKHWFQIILALLGVFLACITVFFILATCPFLVTGVIVGVILTENWQKISRWFHDLMN